MSNQPMVTVGVVADTHVPDRVEALHPNLLPALKSAGVSLILHAGDISDLSVLTELEQIAPVKAVMGNRDWRSPNLPKVIELDLAGMPVVLTHGHGGWLGYLRRKLVYMRNGYQFEYYLRQLRTQFPDARLIVFGHTHRIENRVVESCLFFNPGAAYSCHENSQQPRVGVLRFYSGGQVKGQVINLCETQGSWRSIG